MAFRVLNSFSFSSHRYEQFSSVKVWATLPVSPATVARMVPSFVSRQTWNQAHPVSRPTIPRIRFFPCVLIHLVGFDLWIRQLILRRPAGEPAPLSLPGHFLNAGAPLQHRRAVEVHLVRSDVWLELPSQTLEEESRLARSHSKFSTTPYR